MNKKNRPLAYGENTYDFEGKRQFNGFADFDESYREYSSGEEPIVDTTNASTTKLLLFVAIGGIVFTGLLIWILGKKKK